jgi:hypothetical protein
MNTKERSGRKAGRQLYEKIGFFPVIFYSAAKISKNNFAAFVNGL